MNQPSRQTELHSTESPGEDFSAGIRNASRVLPGWQMPALFKSRTGERTDWEALIGGSWLNVIGIVVFVVGMALLAQHSVRQFGPVGKIATGVLTGGALVICGVLLERAERYRLLAWTLVGGGWALLYFTAYAAYNIDASRIITNPAIGLLVLGGVGAGIIVHSLKYRSQLVTGLAYGLGFLAVTLTPLNAYTLVASALLAGSQIVLLRVLPWHYLALIAVAGTYLNHARWLGETIGSRPEFWLSQSILAFYWVLFIAMALVRKPKSRQEDLIHLTVNFANTVGLLGLSAWQIWVLHGENLHYLTASATIAYVIATGVSRINGRADLFRFNGSVCAILFAVTLPLALRPFDIPRDWLAIYWAFGGLFIVACGYLLRELILRLEGYALCGAGWLAVFLFNLQSALPLADWRSPHWWIVPSVAALLIALSEFLQRVAGQEGMLPRAGELGRAYSYAATAVLAGFLWKVSDPQLVALSWSAAGLVFFELGAFGARPLLRNQAYVLFELAFAALLTINLSQAHPQSFDLAGASLLPSWAVVGFSAGVYYYVFWRLRRARCGFALSLVEPSFADLLSVSSTTLLAILAWTELDASIVALAWITTGVLLFEVGAVWPRPLLRQQGHVLFGLAFAALLAINLFEVYSPSSALFGGGTLPRWGIVGISAAIFYYIFWRLRRERCGFALSPIEPTVADLLSIASTALLTLLAWQEIDPTIVALAWITIGIVLFEAGAAWPRPLLRHQGYVLFGLAFGALLAVNLIEAFPLGLGLAGAGLLPNWAVVSISAPFYYYVFWRVRRERAGFALSPFEPSMADLLSIAGTTLLTLLAWKELDPAIVALAWIVTGVVLFEVGAVWPRPLLRDQGYLLFGFAFGALLTVNLFEVYPQSLGLAGAGLLPNWAIVGISAAAYYYVFWRLRRERCGFALSPIEPSMADLLSIAGTTLLTLLAWKELDPAILALAWIVTGVVLFEVGAVWPRPLLRDQSYLLFGFAFGALLTINLFEVYPPSLGLAGAGLLPNWAVVGISAAVYYYVFWRLRRERSGFALSPIEPSVADLLSVAGTTLLTLIAWKELDHAIVALAWMTTGIVLFEVGAVWPRPLLRIQGYLLFGLVFAPLLTINLLEAPPSPGLAGAGLLPSWTVVGISAAAYYYVFWRLRRERCGFALSPIEPKFADLLSVSGTLLLTLLAWKELHHDNIGLAWIITGLVLFEAGAVWPRPLLRNQGYALFGLAFTALLTINLFESYQPSFGLAGAGLLPRPVIVGISAGVFYYVFWRLRRERWGFAQTLHEAKLTDLLSIAATALLAVLAWTELDSVTVALAWGFLALILFEVGQAARLTRIAQQGHVLAGLTFGRLFMANFVALGESIGISHRLLTVLPIAALFYYFYSQTSGLPAYRVMGKQLQMSRLYSWGGAIVLLALARFELGRAYAVLGMAPLFVVLVVLGRYLRDTDLRIQAYLLGVMTFARCWATNAYLIGVVAYGLPERTATMLPVVAAFVLATAICMRGTNVKYDSAGRVLVRLFHFVDANPHRFFALLGTALMAILFYYELPSGWVTIAFAIEALLLILVGMATEERSFRIYGLALLLIALLKLVTIDVSGVETIYRILSYIALGLVLLLASLIYTRYRSVIAKYV